MSIIKALFVEKFRGLANQNFPIGERITVISGQNATHKTTLLGLLAQPFVFRDIRTVYDKVFQAKFSDSFKFSKRFDVPKEHCYYIHFTDKSNFGKEKEVVKSFPRPKNDTSHIRLVTGDSRKEGDGNLKLPVIYLTLKRVHPIGESKAVASTCDLTDSELEFFQQIYKRLMVTSSKINVSAVKSSSLKNTLAPHESNYDGLTISAGQDNLGQIIGAIISFRRVKERLGNDYKGGLFLIDEFEATLHQVVKEKLLKWLFEESERLNLQVVFTTHSLDLLRYFIGFKKERSLNSLKLLYLTKSYGKLEILEDPNFALITADMNAQALQEEIRKNRAVQAKIDVFCEDDEATKFLEYLLGPELRKLVGIHSLKVGKDDLKRFSRCRTSFFSQSLFCPDGDAKKGGGNNVIFLPGDSSPEKVFHGYISNLPEDHDFFLKLKDHNRYTKQVFLKSAGDTENWDRDKWKLWFRNEQKKWCPDKKNWKGFYRLFKFWSSDNVEMICRFKKDFQRAYNMLAKQRRLSQISGQPTKNKVE